MSDFFSRLKRAVILKPNDLDQAEREVAERFAGPIGAEIKRQVEEIYNKPPRIAFIGKTGVGKSSTINALFSPTPLCEVGHVRATTKTIREEEIFLDEERGSIIIVDCPGLSESKLADKRIVPQYESILATCEVAVWILKADDRALGDDQRLIENVLPYNLREKLVVAINQIDIIQPGEWIPEYNLPSRQQENSIAEKILDVGEKLHEINVAPSSIVPYSAQQKYRLTHLFKAIMDAFPIDRAWVLGARQGIETYSAPIRTQRDR